MCVLDCAPSALKLLHNSPEFMPFVIFIAAPGMDQLKQLYAERRATGGSQRNLAVSQCTKLILELSGVKKKVEKNLLINFFNCHALCLLLP